jgi:hypothetical protein
MAPRMISLFGIARCRTRSGENSKPLVLLRQTVHGVPAQAQDLGGFPLGAPGPQQFVHGGVAVEGARYQGPLAAVHVPQPVRHGRRGLVRAGVRELAGRRVFALGGRLTGRGREAAAVLVIVADQAPGQRGTGLMRNTCCGSGG